MFVDEAKDSYSYGFKKKCQSKLMGRGCASAIQVYAHTYKCQNIILFKYSRVIHQKKHLEPQMNKQKICFAKY